MRNRIPYTDIELGTPEAKKEMEARLMAFYSAGINLLHAWDDNLVKAYPKYLPSFDDFILEFAQIMEERKS